MDQAPSKCLRFDRFTLDLARTALRFDNQEIFPRPKAFTVLRCLAENAGRLVRKQELFEIVWPGVEVTDDSLVQCVRELRLILGDKEHRLIKTVTRRGYLLDADVRTLAPNSAESSASQVAPMDTVSRHFTPARLPSSALNKLFTDADAQRVAEIAQSKRLPLPRIEIDTPDDDVPLAIRRFVGIWASKKGFVGTNRQFMLIVTHVEKEGLAGGYTVRGPPAPNSRVQNPAEAVAFTAHIADNALTYTNPRGSYRVWFARGRSLVFQQTYVDRYMTMVALEPVWTLLEAERAVEKRRSRAPQRQRGADSSSPSQSSRSPRTSSSTPRS
jgi:DNA-binding winged helix-turn-helix (wHTH) protein